MTSERIFSSKSDNKNGLAIVKYYEFVPIQNFDEPWDDEKLYKKYNISLEEQNFIDKLIRPIE